MPDPFSDAAAWRRPDARGADAVRWRPLLDAARTREFVVDLVEVAAGGRTPVAMHRQAEVDYVVAGRARTVVAGAVTEVGPGTCLYHPPGARHTLEAAGDGPLRYVRTFACERLPAPVRAVDAPDDAGTSPAWVGREETAAWRAVEPTKGMKIRVKRLLDRGVELMAGVCEFDPGVHYTRHWHDQPEIYVVLDGAGVVYRGDAAIEVAAGGTLYLASREVHGLDSLAATPLRLFWVYGCETAGHTVNWTPVEPIYERARRAGAPGSDA